MAMSVGTALRKENTRWKPATGFNRPQLGGEGLGRGVEPVLDGTGEQPRQHGGDYHRPGALQEDQRARHGIALEGRGREGRVMEMAESHDAGGDELPPDLRNDIEPRPLRVERGGGALDGLGNAAAQIEGATRSTTVNLFHIVPLVYSSLEHTPQQIAWGHAICNTRLGQRRCYSLQELKELDLKVGVIRKEGIDTFGWISKDFQMIRSPLGAVWIQLNADTLTEEDSNPPPAAASS